MVRAWLHALEGDEMEKVVVIDLALHDLVQGVRELWCLVRRNIKSTSHPRVLHHFHNHRERITMF